MQTALLRIWTQIALSPSYDDTRNATIASILHILPKPKLVS